MYMDKTPSGISTLINEDVADSKKSTSSPLAAIDAALSKVDAVRSSLGAIQNRFDSAITNLGNTVNNLSSAVAVSKMLTTRPKCLTCLVRRSCNKQVLLFWHRLTRPRRTYCLCCVNRRYILPNPAPAGFFLAGK